MKRLKKWVEIVLKIIFFVSFIIMASDSENLTLFVVLHVVATATFILTGYILIKNRKEN